MKKLLFILLGLGLMFESSYAAFTRGQVRTLIKYELRDMGGAYFPDTVISAAINVGMNKANTLANGRIKRFQILTVSGTFEYAAPSDFLLPLCLFNKDEQLRLNYIDIKDLGLGTVSPLAQFSFYDTTIVIAQKPDKVDTLWLFYTAEADTIAQAIANDTTKIKLNDNYIGAIVYFSLEYLFISTRQVDSSTYFETKGKVFMTDVLQINRRILDMLVKPKELTSP